MDLKIKTFEAKAETRPLRVAWTREMAADLNSMHSIDLEKGMESIFRSHSRMSKAMKIFRK